MLAKLWRRSGGVHVAEEVLDPPKGDAAARVTHLQRWIGWIIVSHTREEPQQTLSTEHDGNVKRSRSVRTFIDMSSSPRDTRT